MGRRKRDDPDREIVDHELPVGSMSQADMIVMLIGSGISISRSGPAATIPVGGRVNLSIPAGMAATVEATEDGLYFDITEGNPSIKLPLIGKVWPVVVEGLRLSGDTMTIELDGWKDYQIKVLP